MRPGKEAFVTGRDDDAAATKASAAIFSSSLPPKQRGLVVLGVTNGEYGSLCGQSVVEPLPERYNLRFLKGSDPPRWRNGFAANESVLRPPIDAEMKAYASLTPGFIIVLL
jgi:hypothetical protein